MVDTTDVRIPAASALRGERRDHVVRLPALELEVPVAERLDDRPKVRELLAQEVGHRLAALLVDHLDRLGGGGAVHRPRVPGDGDALRLVVGEELEQHVREPEQRARRKALGGGGRFSGSAKKARYARLLPSTRKSSASRAGASSRSSSRPVNVFGDIPASLRGYLRVLRYATRAATSACGMMPPSAACSRSAPGRSRCRYGSCRRSSRPC